MNYFLRNAINSFLQLEQKEQNSGGKNAGNFTTEYILYVESRMGKQVT